MINFFVVCPMRYKTKSGLDQHIAHAHAFPKEEHPVPSQPEIPSLESVIDSGPSAVVTPPPTKEKVKNPVC